MKYIIDLTSDESKLEFSFSSNDLAWINYVNLLGTLARLLEDTNKTK